MKTPMQEFLKQIILAKKEGSVYLLPAITDVQIEELLEKEKQLNKKYFDAGITTERLYYTDQHEEEFNKVHTDLTNQ